MRTVLMQGLSKQLKIYQFGPNSGSSSQVKINKGKEPRKDAYENTKEALADKLYTLPLSNNDTPRGCRDVEIDLKTMDYTKLCMGLLFKDELYTPPPQMMISLRAIGMLNLIQEPWIIQSYVWDYYSKMCINLEKH